MQLNVPRREPATATRRQRLWLWKDSKAKDIAVKGFRLGLPAGRHGKLNVIEGDDSGWHPVILPLNCRHQRPDRSPWSKTHRRRTPARVARLIGVLIAEAKVTVLAVPDMTTVSLRTRTDHDLDLLFSIATDLETWEERNSKAPAPLTRDIFDARLARAAASEPPEETVLFVVDVDGVAVGRASLFGFDSFARHAEAGISLVPDARGRGIGTAAIAQLVEFGFVRRNLRRIHLQAISSNTGAIRAYEKAGFVVEGRLRQHAWVRGEYEDIVIMGILRSEHTVPT
jgi:RimJ/RimL family protein N-acetyltransferase